MARRQSASVTEVRRLQDLLSDPREDLDRELKPWLKLSDPEDRANIGQAILALANHGGGYVLLGFQEQGGRWMPADGRPSRLDTYSQDRVNGIVLHFADPPFHCEVHHVPHPETGDLFPVIVVPGGHRVPIRARRSGPNNKHVRENSYYIRRPGPVSEPPQSAREWDELIGRCVRAAREELLEGIRLIIGERTSPLASGAEPEEEARRKLDAWVKDCLERWSSRVGEKFGRIESSPYAKGVWYVAYTIVHPLQTPTVRDFLEILRRVKGHETGWAPWWVPTREEIRPRPHKGLVECWIIDSHLNDPAHSDFWRGSPRGSMFLLRGYEEDSAPDRWDPGTALEVTLPVWRVGECLLHAERLALAVGVPSSPVVFRAHWRGLSGRNLRALPTATRAFDDFDVRGHRCTEDEAQSEIVIAADRIGVNLPEIVGELVGPLYEAFDFFALDPEIVRAELSHMRGRSR